MSTVLDALATRPRGRDQVTAALLAATESLCSSSQPSSFTVNDIAQEANVTTSLLYFYFGSKDDLVIATLRSIASDMDALAAEEANPREMATVVKRSLTERPAFARIIAWFVLEGRSVSEEMGDQPFLRRLIATLAADESDDPHTEAGAVVSILLAKALLSGDINSALGRETDDERLTEALDDSIGRILMG
jgi:AcrR family transcriptional regulator